MAVFVYGPDISPSTTMRTRLLLPGIVLLGLGFLTASCTAESRETAEGRDSAVQEHAPSPYEDPDSTSEGHDNTSSTMPLTAEALLAALLANAGATVGGSDADSTNIAPLGSCSYFNPRIIDYYRAWEDFALPSVAAVAGGDSDALSAAMQANPDERPFRNIPLVLASYTGCTELMLLLVEIGNDVNEPGTTTPLQAAATSRNLAAVQLLLDHGADPNLASDYESGRSLDAAAYYDWPEAIELLLDAGADLNATDIYGSTALQAAGVSNSVAAATVLLDAGIEFSAHDLKDAILSDSAEFLRLLVDRGDINRISDAERTQLADDARAGADPVLSPNSTEIIAMLEPDE